MTVKVVVTFDLEDAESEEYDAMYELLKNMGINKKKKVRNTVTGELANTPTASTTYDKIKAAAEKASIPLSALYVGIVDNQAYSV